MTTKDETPAELKDHIRVHAEGVDEPLFFPPDTSDEHIQSAVQQAQAESKQATAQQDDMFADTPARLAAAGGLAGGVVGAASPVPGGVMLGAGLGATAGHYAGKAIQDFSRGIDQSVGRISDNLIDAVKTGAISGASEGLAPMIGSVVGAAKNHLLNLGAKIGNKLFVPKPASELTKTSEKVLAQSGAPGLTLGQLYDDPASKHAANIMENMAYNALTTRVVNNVRNRQVQGLKDHIQALKDQWNTLSHEDAVETLGWAIKDNFEQLVKAPMTVAMNDLKTQLPGRVVNVNPTLKALTVSPNSEVLRSGLEQILKKSRSMDPQTYDDLIKLVQPTTGKVATQARPNLTLDQAMRLKTALDTYGRRKVSDEAGQRVVTEAQMKGEEIDQAIKASLKGTPSLLRSYESSQQMYAEGIQTYKNELLKNAFAKWEKEPGMFADMVLNKNKTDLTKALREAAGDAVWKSKIEPKLAGHLLLEAFGKNMDGPLSGTALANRAQNLSVNGTMQAAFDSGMYKRLLDLARVIEHVTPTPKGAGGVLIQLSQAGVAGAVPGLITGLSTGDSGEGVKTGLATGATVLLAPRLLGKLVADPKYTEAFKKGLLTSQQQGKPSSHLLMALRQLAATETTQQTVLTNESNAPAPSKAPAQPSRSLTVE